MPLITSIISYLETSKWKPLEEEREVIETCLAGNKKVEAGNYEEVLFLFQKAIKIDPRKHFGYSWSVNSKSWQRKFYEAIDEYNKAV